MKKSAENTTPRVTPARIAAIGTFDGMHLGHQSLLRMLTDEAALRHLDPMVVTFAHTPRASIDPTRKVQRLMSVDERVKALHKAGINHVAILDFTPELRMLSAAKFLDMLHRKYSVEALIMGFNHRFGHDRPTDYDAIGRDNGVEIIHAGEFIDPKSHKVSSSAIRTLLEEGRIDDVTRLLGRHYTITGTVAHGHQLGRSIGFPTANIVPLDPLQLIPRRGVYAARVIIPGNKTYGAMLNIGHRPTVEGSENTPMTIEANLLDFEGDLYGAVVTVEFIRYLRPERWFDSLDALKAALETDRLATATLLDTLS